MKRTYESQQGCPIARSLDVFGDRWTMLLMRDLHDGHYRFADLLRSLDGISPNLLSSRLKRLEERGIVTRRLYNIHPPRAEYVLTEPGEAFWPILEEITTWGNRFSPVETNGTH